MKNLLKSATLLIILAFAQTNFAQIVVASGRCGDSLYWEITATETDSILTISGTGIAMWNYYHGNLDVYTPWRSYNRSIRIIVFNAPNLTNISAMAFSYCQNLTSVEIPNNIIWIDEFAFYSSRMEKLIIADGSTRLGLLYDGRRYDYQNQASFRHCLIDTLYMGRNTGIYDWSVMNSFVEGEGTVSDYFGSGIKHLTIGDSVTRIARQTFWTCPITILNISKSVNSIERRAFDASYLDTVIVHWATPLVVDTGSNSPFLNVTTSASHLVVPAGTEELYRNAPVWQDFNIVGASPVPVTNITNVPTTATAGTPLKLTATVNPNNAIQAITWSVQTQGTTGATISNDTLYTTSAGTTQIRATITNGTAQGTNYTQDFNITVGTAVFNTDLASLSVEGATLNPAFSPSITNYTCTVSYEDSVITIDAVPNSPSGIIWSGIGAKSIKSGANTYPLQVGENVFQFVIASSDNSAVEKTYTVVVTRSAPTSIFAEIENTGTLKIHPNPVNDELRISNYDYQPGDIIQLFDITGKRVYVETANAPPATITIDMSPFPTGIYILRIGTHTAKIVKQ